MPNYFKLLAAYFRTSIIGELAYRANFLINLFQSFLNLGISLAGLGIIFSYTSSLNGWKPDEILALVGVYFMMGGVVGLMVSPGMEWLTTAVRDGSLDFVLTKPEDSQVIISVQAVNIWKIIDIILGIVVLAIALIGLGSSVGATQAVLFISLVISGAAIIYSFLLMLTTLSFWFVRVENILVIFQSVYEAGRWPVSLYPAWLRYGLTFIIPVAFAVTVPAEALIGRSSLAAAMGSVAAAIVLLVVSRLFWKFGLKHYSGASA